MDYDKRDLVEVYSESNHQNRPAGALKVER